MGKSQMNNEKEAIRKIIIEKKDIVNIKHFCECTGINYVNMRKFISGMLSCMTLENAKKLLDYIDYVDKYEFK